MSDDSSNAPTYFPSHVWIVNRLHEYDPLYVFEDEHRARDFASRYAEDDVVVTEEVVMNDRVAGEFLIATADYDCGDCGYKADTREELLAHLVEVRTDVEHVVRCGCGGVCQPVPPVGELVCETCLKPAEAQ